MWQNVWTHVRVALGACHINRNLLIDNGCEADADANDEHEHDDDGDDHEDDDDANDEDATG